MLMSCYLLIVGTAQPVVKVCIDMFYCQQSYPPCLCPSSSSKSSGVPSISSSSSLNSVSPSIQTTSGATTVSTTKVVSTSTTSNIQTTAATNDGKGSNRVAIVNTIINFKKKSNIRKSGGK